MYFIYRLGNWGPKRERDFAQVFELTARRTNTNLQVSWLRQCSAISNSLSTFSPKIYSCIWKPQSKKTDLIPIGSPIRWSQWPRLGQPKGRSQELHLSLLVGSRDPITGVSFNCLSEKLYAKLASSMVSERTDYHNDVNYYQYLWGFTWCLSMNSANKNTKINSNDSYKASFLLPGTTHRSLSWKATRGPHCSTNLGILC